MSKNYFLVKSIEKSKFQQFSKIATLFHPKIKKSKKLMKISKRKIEKTRNTNKEIPEFTNKILPL